MVMILTEEEEKRQKKAEAVMKQPIRIGFEDDPNSFKRIPRHRVNKATLNRVFDCDVAYLKDEVGTVVFPEQWITDCIQAPLRYFLVRVEVLPKALDALRDVNYKGEHKLVIRDVPKDVSSKDLIVWIKKGLEEEDNELQIAQDKLAAAEKILERNQARLDQVPFMETNTGTVAEAAYERKMAQSRLEDERAKQLSKIENLEKKYFQEVARKEQEQIRCEVASVDATKSRSVMYLSFPGNRGHIIEDQIVDKESWSHVFLSLGYDETLPAIASLKTIPSEIADTNVSMRAVRIARMRHGQGSYMYPDGTAYIGKWVEDQPHGSGKLFTKLCKFTGEFQKGKLFGSNCEIAWNNGDKYVGNVNGLNALLPGETVLQVTRPCEVPLILTDMFHFGVPHGKGTFEFKSGGKYEGEFRNGRMHGKGTYVNERGEKQVGRFVDGMLDSGIDEAMLMNRTPEVCQLRTEKRDEYKGWFRAGMLDRKGEFNDKNGDRYSGSWDRGRMDGRGTFTYANGDRYLGYMRAGLRNGRGSLSYGNVVPRFDVKTGKTFLECDHMVEGQWLAGRIRGGGLIANISHGDDGTYSEEEEENEVEESVGEEWGASDKHKQKRRKSKNSQHDEEEDQNGDEKKVKREVLTTVKFFYTTNVPTSQYVLPSELQIHEDRRFARKQRMYKRLHAERNQVRVSKELSYRKTERQRRRFALDAYARLQTKIEVELRTYASKYDEMLRDKKRKKAILKKRLKDLAMKNRPEEEQNKKKEEGIEEEVDESESDESDTEVDPFKPSMSLTLAEMLDDLPPADLAGYLRAHGRRSAAVSGDALEYYMLQLRDKERVSQAKRVLLG